MRLKLTSVVQAAAAVFLPLAAANAQYGAGSVSNVCGGLSFTFCFAISSSQSGSDFLLTITNEALNGSNASPYNTLVFTRIGFNETSITPTFTSTGTSSMDLGVLTQLSNFAGTWTGVDANPPVAKDGLLFGESVTFDFANTTASTFPTTDLAIMAQAGPGGCSSKLEVDLSKPLAANGTQFKSCGLGSPSPPPPVTTPEPATLVLMASGLLPLAGIAVKRRLL